MKNSLYALVVLLGLVGGIHTTFAQTTPNTGSSEDALSKITYPIAELDNCDNREACRLYCDQSSHRDACFTFAQKQGLMSKEKIDAAKLVLSKKGPGSCGSKDECASYCKDSAHQGECLSFAQLHKIISTSTAMLINKLSSGEGPGACKSSQTCKMYCEDPTHADECKAFAEENGLGKRPPRMSSTTPFMPRPMASSSIPRGDVRLEMHKDSASSTQQQLRLEVRPTSGEFKRPPQQQPSNPQTNKEDLGAAAWRAFAHLLGF